jgi:phage-related protein
MARGLHSRNCRAVYVLHFFQKKSKKGIATPQQHIDLVMRRLREAREFAKRGQQ